MVRGLPGGEVGKLEQLTRPPSYNTGPMNRDFDPNARSFSSLSVKDLLDARDAYHVHLCHLDNVFATAIGRFLIRDTDPDHDRYVSVSERREGREGSSTARTLENSTAKAWSWPCVLVFVTEWETPEQLHKRRGRVVPPFLYLDDGRIIPTCVVKASLYQGPRSAPASLKYTSHLIGGGYPLLTDVQGAEQMRRSAAPPADGGVPTPGDAQGVAVPSVQAAAGTSEQSHAAEGVKTTALAPPGKPDGEVDTRA